MLEPKRWSQVAWQRISRCLFGSIYVDTLLLQTVPCTPRLLVTTGSDASSAYVAVTSCAGTGLYGVEDGEEVEAEDGGPYVLPEGFQVS